MRNVFLLALTLFAFTAFQSCSKCGHCHTEVSSGTTTVKSDGDTYCGDNGNESGSYRKAAEVNCERWPDEQTPVNGVTYSSSWEVDK